MVDDAVVQRSLNRRVAASNTDIAGLVGFIGIPFGDSRNYVGMRYFPQIVNVTNVLVARRVLDESIIICNVHDPVGS